MNVKTVKVNVKLFEFLAAKLIGVKEYELKLLGRLQNNVFTPVTPDVQVDKTIYEKLNMNGYLFVTPPPITYYFLTDDGTVYEKLRIFGGDIWSPYKVRKLLTTY